MSMRYLFLVILLTGLGACNKHTVSWQPEIMEPATGATSLLAATDMTGKTIVINYWADWCKPCLEEIPELNRFAEQHAAGVIVLAVNFDQPERSKQQAAAQRAGIRYPLLMEDPATALGLPQVEGLPMTFVVNDQGELKQALAGQQTLASLETALSAP